MPETLRSELRNGARGSLGQVFPNPDSGAFRAQAGFAAGAAAQRIKDFVETIDFHLVNDAEEFPETALREATFSREPREVFHRQIVDGHTARREVRGAEFAERHARRRDVREVCGHPIAQAVFIHA